MAGVSPITVSRALRTPELVAATTRAKVNQAVDRLGYLPNLLASGLASNRSRVIAVIVPTIANSIFSDSLQGMSDRLRESAYQLIISDSGYSDTVESELAVALLGRRPDGLVLLGNGSGVDLRRLLGNADIPVVQLWELPEDPIDSAVGFSNFDALYALTEHLIEIGYRRIAFLSNRADRRARARLAGYQACLNRHGLGEGPIVFPPNGDTVADPIAAFAELKRAHLDIDAVCCANDVIALELLFFCQRQRWQVPEQLAIAGFCDLAFAHQTHPALTTVRIPSYKIGLEAARLILARLSGEINEPVTLDLGFEIIQRDST